MALRCASVLAAVDRRSPTAGACASTTSATRTAVPCCTSTARPTRGGPATPTTARPPALGVRLIAVDRPGAGGSDPHPAGTVGLVRRRRRGARRPPRDRPLGRARLVGRGAVRAWPSPPATRRWSSASASSPGCRRSPPTPSPGCSTAPAPTAGRSPSSAPRWAPPAVAELLAPLVAPWPCDLDLAREFVLEGADDVRRAELAAVPGAVDAMAAGVVDAVAQGLGGADARHRAAGARPRHRPRRRPLPGAAVVRHARTTRRRRRSARWFARHLPDASLEVIDGAGHCLLLPRWTEILRSVR